LPVQKLLAKIHIAKKQLGLDEETYRAALEGQTGKRSAATMSIREITKCLNHFVSLGWQPKMKPKKYDDQKGDLYSASPAIKRKIEAMWHDYHHNHCRCDDEKRHLRRWLFSKFKISDVAFLDKRGAYDAVEALKSMTRRRVETETRRQGNAIL
jgi:phage gp16-like protein